MLFIGMYIMIRGIFDPIRRSKKRMWWEGDRLAFFASLILAPVIDCAKVTGFLFGLWQMAGAVIVLSGKNVTSRLSMSKSSFFESKSKGY